jgi:hypothetical protein
MVVPICLSPAQTLELGTHVPDTTLTNTRLAVAFVMLAHFNKLNAIGLGFQISNNPPLSGQNHRSFAYID